MLNTKIIGNKIVKARKETNMSQAQLAELLFISPQAIGKWERGESIPDLITFNRLAEILNVDLNYFSENFQSTTNKLISNEVLEKQTSESTPEKTDKKPKWNMSLGNWIDADFSGLKNLHEKFSSSNMQRCKFIGSDLSGLILKNNQVDSCDFSRSDISNSYFHYSHIVNTLFKDCSLNETEFSGSHIKGCDFSGADFTGTVIKSSSFQKSILTNVVLNRTSFNATDISDMIFEGTIEDCYFENSTFSKVTFQNSKLIHTFFKSRSLKHIKFIDCQADRITYEFLKNGKADVSGIILLTS
ncbi:transcriptional regulator [Chryseobacterium elymi]|uniref:Transcriptional regulator n=1 Tax=Chryseobacterium elymi TaxID=395936 RepID=A0A3D9DMF1_9FLAO|nr:pentapeptide repeat-containing protein [Chryseobacterium elymi]REC79139.1 transcriptional regulator [Chryseobacterium elymi]